MKSRFVTYQRLARCVALLATWSAGGCVIAVSPGDLFGSGQALEEHVLEGSGAKKILLIDISGFIGDRPDSQAFGLRSTPSLLERTQAQLEKAGDDDDIAAVVLRINSPGGGVTASDELFGRLEAFRTRSGLPLVAALGTVATSGAYYAACAADRIVAHPTTITGSIGVILPTVSAEGLLDKVGIRNETYTAGRNKDLLSPLREATPDQREIVQRLLDGMHARFLAVVTQNRPDLASARLDAIGDGRIFGAGEALELGLVDQIGRLHDAIALARSLAGVEQARVILYTRGGGNPQSVYAAAATPAGQSPLHPALSGSTRPRGALYLWPEGLGL